MSYTLHGIANIAIDFTPYEHSRIGTIYKISSVKVVGSE